MGQKMSENGLKMVKILAKKVQKRPQHGPKMAQMIQKWFRNGSKMVKNDPKVIQKWSKMV